jgi:hypothetical protein
MPRVNVSNGVRPEIRALAVMKLGIPVTPAEINAHVGTGDYAAKYVSFLNTRYGFTISAQKDGRKVVSYTIESEPDNVAELRSAQPKEKKEKETKAKVEKKAKPSKPVSVAPAPKAKAAKKGGSAANLAKLKEIGKRQKKIVVDEVEQTFGDSGEIGSIDGGWDSIEGLDLSKIL